MNPPRDKASSSRLAPPAHGCRRGVASAIAAVILGLLAFPAFAAESVGGLRGKLLAGEAIVFTANQPEVERTVSSTWLAEAARKGTAVNVTRAVIIEPLDLRHAAVTNRFRLHQCVFKAAADCSFAVFEQGYDFSDSQFAADASFTGALARRAALLRGTAFSGAATFTDATAEDVFLAQGAAFLGKESKFNRATFLKTAGFGPAPGQPAASFNGNVTFEGARFAGAVDFNRVRFGGGTNSQAVFKDTRCERVTTFRGAEFRGASTFATAQFLGTVAFGPEGEGPGALPPARFAGPADFASAQFGGEADFAQVQFLRPAPVSFDGCAFKDYARFGQAQFAGGALFSQANFSALADFERARFQGTEEGPAVSFQDSSIGGRANFVGGQFIGAADFRNARFGGETAFNGAVFATEALFTYARFGHTVSFGALGAGAVPGASFADVAIFTGVKFELDAFFEQVKFTATNRPVSFSAAAFGAETAFDGAQFAGDANFVRATFTSAATFTGTVFQNPEMTAQFNSIKAGKTLNFTGARFAGPLDFVAAEAVGPVQFAGVVFGGDASFNAMAVERHAVFGPIGTNSPTHFKKSADFIAIRIGGQLDLAAARFDGEALFRGANLQRGLILSWRPGGTGAVHAAEFRARADFRNLQAAERVQMAGVTFHNEAAFDSTKWEVPMAFEEVRFRRGASLTRAAFPQGADFSSARFKGLLDLTDSTFRTLRLTSESQWTDGPIELRGSTYEEFSGNVDALLEAFTRADRPVLTRLERSLRQVGRDDEADAVYLQNQQRERRQTWVDHKYGEWFFRSLYGALGNYGVRPYRLLVFSAILVWLGALVFKLPGAVRHRDKAAQGTPLTTFDAVALSICYFLPVEFPLEEEWIAATSPLSYRLPFLKKHIQVRPAAIANFVLRLSGWIVVPLSLAAVTGLLKVNN
ncbi:MAG: hypothetical protein FD161_93 [Limisphaerales bacterium]|nr:MAG: hypothetical protein FD161_93 [Limisphaerales bacterium]KAG0510539.1 MAG: hypothetical protein E1N63_93 [Limisphaerales bacterium]TXT52812.1 MAG: hypothetical protein FD140_355 [Limisphaerales bacterium]